MVLFIVGYFIYVFILFIVSWWEDIRVFIFLLFVGFGIVLCYSLGLIIC